MKIRRKFFAAVVFLAAAVLLFPACSILMPPPPLVTATGQGDANLVKALVGQGVDINAADSKGATSMLIAACKGNNEIAKQLIAAGADVNAAVTHAFECGKNKLHKGSTPLMAALANHHDAVALMLLENGADITVVDSNGAGPLVYAALGGDPQIVEAVLKQRANINATIRKDFEYEKEPIFAGFTPLMCALQLKRENNAKALISLGADVRAKCKNGIEAIIIAAYKGESEMVRILLEKGADPKAALTRGFTIGGRPVFKGDNALMAAADAGDAQSVSEIVNAGADVNGGDENGVTPLMAAAAKGRLAAVTLLVSLGADVDAKTTKTFHLGPDPIPAGTPVLSIAALGGHPKTIRFLLGNKANVNAKDNVYGMDPLFLAAYNGHFEAVKILIKYGADVFAVNNMGTALNAANHYRFAEMARVIEDARAKAKAGESKHEQPATAKQ